MAAEKRRYGRKPQPAGKVRKKDKLLFAANATPESLLLLSSSNASLCVWYGRLPDIHARKIKTPDANTSNRKRLNVP